MSISKQDILDNVSQYNADELVQYIKDGIVTFDELCDDREEPCPAKIRKEVKNKLDHDEEDVWQNAQSSKSKESVQRYLDVYANGKYASQAQRLIETLKEEEEDVEVNNIWNEVDKNDKDELNKFIQTYPNNKHSTEAKSLMNEIDNEKYMGYNVAGLLDKIIDIEVSPKAKADNSFKNKEIYNVIREYFEKKRITSDDLVSIIENDNNIFPASIVRKLVDDGYLELRRLKINDKFVGPLLKNVSSNAFNMPQPINHITKTSTEIYFWGIPSSGKTCVVGSLLSVAGSGSIAESMEPDQNCQGYNYMTQLSQIFKKSDVPFALFSSTPTLATYEMGFDLYDDKDRQHPITCIDMAGELMRCFYKEKANLPLSVEQKAALQIMRDILVDNRTDNRKIHFFVIEYGGDKKKYEGIDQDIYLESALSYLSNVNDKNGNPVNVFKRKTDAVYIIVTKVDKIKVSSGKEFQNILKQYIKDKYQNFYKSLKRVCKENEINEGNVVIIPFSLGEVCFQNYCLFKDDAAKNLVKMLLSRSKGFYTGKLKFINYIGR